MNSQPIIPYSIIICAYNPDENILRRCLNAVQSLNVSNILTEIIFVDNNSQPALYDQEYIRQFVHSSSVIFLNVEKQGLSYARSAGIKAAKGKYIVFFDDDNEPEENYIIELVRLHSDFPEVIAWGPGTVNVDFLGEVDEKLRPLATAAFQDRHETSVLYSNEPSWQPFYPYGTGLSINREYLLQYISLVEENKFTLTGRSGGQLTSGEDVQMVLFCLSKGASAGVSPQLSITHMVPSQRGTLAYLVKLTYGTSVSYSTCVAEVFPDHIKEVYAQIMPERKFIRRVLKKFISLTFNPNPIKKIDLVRYIGAIAGDYKAINKPLPSLVGWVLTKLKAI